MATQAGTHDGATGARARVKRPLIWVVDDSALEAAVVREALSSEFEVESFVDGGAVLERSANSPLPEVLVLDWVMPGISGIDICQFLRAKNDQLPILLLTVNRQTEHLVEGLSAGANDFVSKPFSAPELRARVRALFNTRQIRERVEQHERERAEAERKRADAAEERARLSELYLGIIGHDLRNPVTAIAMASGLINRQTTDERVRALGQLIHTSSQRTLEMINALLDVTRTRLGGGIPVHPGPNSLFALCRQVVDELSAVHPERKMLLDVPADDTSNLHFDYQRMSQVVSNLVTNALIHGSGQTPVRIELARAEAEVQLLVHNQGPPLSDDIRAHLFDPFRRGTMPKGGPPGLGLGLYISQQIVIAHGGSISVTSTDTTTFTVHLPLTPMSPSGPMP